MNITKLSLSIIALLFGAFLVIFVGYDDSPGAQLLGVLVMIAGIYSIFKSRKKDSV